MPSQLDVEKIRHTNGTDALTFDSSGNTNLQKDLKFSSTAAIKNSAGNNILSESGGTITLTTNSAVIEGSSSGNLVRITQTGTGNALVVEDSTNPDSTPFVINASGVVGIGTSSPNEMMTIASSSVASYLQICDSSTGSTSGDGLFLGSFNGAAELRTKENTHLSFGTNNTQHMRIDSNGNVGIGLTDPVTSLAVNGNPFNINLPDFKGISIKNGSYADTTSKSGILIEAGHANNNWAHTFGLIVQKKTTYAGASSDFSIKRITASTNAETEDFTIDSSGAITMPAVYSDTVTGRDLYISSSGQLGYVSSIRSSKTNIENLPSISWLYELTPVKFQYRIKDEDDNHTDEAEPEIQYGFIAEDVVEVNSDLVFGDETENGFELRGIQYSRLIAPMIKAIQEQQALIESQQSQIETLTAKTQEQDLTIASLISRIEALETN